MYEIIIRDYVNKLTENDILNFCNKKEIQVNDEETKILYIYAKNYWKEFYKGNPKDLILELKEKINENAFNKLYNLYIDLKKKIK